MPRAYIINARDILCVGIGQCLHCAGRIHTVLSRHDKHWRPMHNIADGLWELHACGWFAGDFKSAFGEQITYVPFKRYSEHVDEVPSMWRYGLAAQ